MKYKLAQQVDSYTIKTVILLERKSVNIFFKTKLQQQGSIFIIIHKNDQTELPIIDWNWICKTELSIYSFHTFHINNLPCCWSCRLTLSWWLERMDLSDKAVIPSLSAFFSIDCCTAFTNDLFPASSLLDP